MKRCNCPAAHAHAAWTTYWLGPVPRSSTPTTPAVDLVQGYDETATQRNSVLVETVLNRTLRGGEKHALDAAIAAYGKFVGLTATRRSRK